MSKETKLQIVKSSVLETVEKQSTPLIRKIIGITISTNEQYEMVAANIAKLKEYRKQAEEELSGIIDPLKLSTKNAQNLFKPFFTQVNESEAIGKAAMLEYVNKNQLKAAKVEQDFEDGKIKRISTVTSKTSELRDTSSESASVKKLWRLTIVNEKKIPREFLVPDESAIKEAFKRGEKVAGCEWKQENTIAI